MTEPHCIFILELISPGESLPVILRVLKERNIVVMEQLILKSGKILLDCMTDEPDRLYRTALIIGAHAGVTSIERMVSKGTMIKMDDT